ncbi:MAG: PEP-CTERM sorting domain-containing protein [Casimicrobiaceae bacterium]
MQSQHAGHRLALVVTAAVGLFLVLPAGAAPISFDFNAITLSGSQGNGLGATANSTAIGTYMTTTLGTPVTVTGALATKTYNGENHVNGATLGTSDHNVTHVAPNDTFIINDDFGIYGGAASSFTMTFGGGFFLTSVAFDWEIFPDASCPASTNVNDCGGSDHSATNANWPDIELMVNGVATPIWSALATIPATTPKDPQAIGTLSAALDLTIYGHAITSLTFVDWPAEVGVDSLTLTGGCLPGAAANDCILRQTPEPGSMLLVGIALSALAVAGRRRIRRLSSTASR